MYSQSLKCVKSAKVSKKAESNYEITHASKQLALRPQSDLLTNGRRPHYVRQSKKLT